MSNAKSPKRLTQQPKSRASSLLTRLAKDQAQEGTFNYASEEYLEGKASLSELPKKTGLDVPTIMDEVASIKGEDKRAVEAFLSAVKTISKLNKDPEFYNLAVDRTSESDA